MGDAIVGFIIPDSPHDGTIQKPDVSKQ